ncbi:Predicted metalloprotease [Streptosporangium subroseum]|uniref:Predicted metalloprotease n=2 Tax=Streptosporangium subroseum TaxID=106412 RepID=A0A239ER65_9ACTN|nr:Predicted metalloprotease [Streptosporangium subroseum]
MADAAAYPIRDAPTLTDNSLYGSGKIKTSTCSGGAISTESSAAAKRTLTALWRCLNTSWSAHFKRAKLPFTPAKLVVITKPTRFCGKSVKDARDSAYCRATKTAAMVVDKKYYLGIREIYPFQSVSELYGEHLQHIIGITDSARETPYDSEAESLEQNRRWSLQGDCLGAVSLRSVWKTAGRGSEGWPAMLKLMKENGDPGSGPRYWGKGANIVYWSDRGFKSGDPGSCNTWKASSARVA